MIHPSYVDLMKVVNKNVEEGETPVINSRYSIVMATAKRARQIVDGDEPLIDDPYGKKPLSIAVEELNNGSIRILTEEEKIADEERVRAEIAASEAAAAEQAKEAGDAADAVSEEAAVPEETDEAAEENAEEEQTDTE